MEKHKELTDFLKYLSTYFSVQICINDFVGFIPLDRELYKTLHPYLKHSNTFCTCIKSDRKLWNKCLLMKSKIFKKCMQEENHFFGICHAGVGEYIYPIFYGKHLLGVINVGIFSSEISSKLIDRICRSSKIDKYEAKKLYGMNMQERFSPDKEEELRINFNFVCKYLTNFFSRLSAGYPVSFHDKNKSRYSENLTLSNCIQYIRANFRDYIDVSTLQSLCHCSESYINHLFKKRTGKGLKSYINELRIDEAKRLLTGTTISVSSIALAVGFQDSDYFSRVFSIAEGISPRQYRCENKKG